MNSDSRCTVRPGRCHFQRKANKFSNKCNPKSTSPNPYEWEAMLESRCRRKNRREKKNVICSFHRFTYVERKNGGSTYYICLQSGRDGEIGKKKSWKLYSMPWSMSWRIFRVCVLCGCMLTEVSTQITHKHGNKHTHKIHCFRSTSRPSSTHNQSTLSLGTSSFGILFGVLKMHKHRSGVSYEMRCVAMFPI